MRLMDGRGSYEDDGAMWMMVGRGSYEDDGW